MNNMRLKKYYTIYKIDKQTNDITNIMDYESPQEIAQAYNLKNIKSIYHYIVKDIDEIDYNNIENLLNCQYFIMINQD